MTMPRHETRELHALGRHAERPALVGCPDCRAARLLRAARTILVDEGYPFPVLEACRRLGVRRNSEEFRIADDARDLAYGDRTELGLSTAAALVEQGVVAKRDLVVELCAAESARDERKSKPRPKRRKRGTR